MLDDGAKIKKEIERYLQKKKWNVKSEGNQWRIKICILCGDSKYHLYINKSSGQYKCWKCGERGNLYKLKKLLGDLTTRFKNIASAFGDKTYNLPDSSKIMKYHKSLLKKKRVLKFLCDEWNISKKEIISWKLGYRKKRDGVMWLCIPHEMDGEFYNIKFRSLPPSPKKFQRVPGCRSVLYNADCLKKYRTVILVEGERDVWTLVKNGFPNTVGTTSGSGSLDPAWIDQLETVELVYIVSDGDIAGQREVLHIAEKVGIEKCKNVIITSNDPSEYFNNDKGTTSGFRAFMRQAKNIDSKNLISIGSAFRDMEENITLENEIEMRIKTPYGSLNTALGGGFSLGDLVILTARPKIGKTTLALNIAMFTVVDQLCPTLIYCLEMKPMKLLQKAICSYRGIPMNEMQTYDIVMTKARFYNKPLYFGYSYEGIDLESVIATFRYAVRRYGIQLIFFDNLHFLVRNASDVTQEIGRVTKTFKLISEELDVCIVLVVHPRKIQGQRIMTSEDLKDSSAIHADADVVIVMHRKKGSDGKLSGMTRLIIDAGRYTESGTEIILDFDGAKSRFKELNPKNEGEINKRRLRKSINFSN